MVLKDWKKVRHDVDMIIWKKKSNSIEIVSHANSKKDIFVNDKLFIDGVSKANALKIAKA